MRQSIFSTGSSVVPLDRELKRIANLPRRSWDESEALELAQELSDILKLPWGKQTLRPLQAVSLFEAGVGRGVFAPMRVGSGKTLPSFLAAEVLEATRPVLLIPAKLRVKTSRDHSASRTHWKINEHLRVMTYEWLGVMKNADALEQYAPDLIVADEAHKLKNIKGAAVASRVHRYMHKHQDTRMIAMSGTFTKRSVLDYAHILEWCLGSENSPLPVERGKLQLWADALDERKGQLRRADPGALLVLCNDEERELWYIDSRTAARRAYRRRLIETPGVVASQETPIDASITISKVDPPFSQSIEDAFTTLRRWRTPDNWPISDGFEMFRHAREVALGFYYIWDPRPPVEWLIARQIWCAFCRQILRYSRTIDSEAEVARDYRDADEYQNWRDIRDTFKPKTHAVWIDDTVIDLCAKWLSNNNGFLWTEHVKFAERLSKKSNVPYFGRGGFDATGKNIRDFKPGNPAIVSMRTINEGVNLQAWNKNFVVSPPPNNLQWEQIIGRTHREGQEEDEVLFDVAAFCLEHISAFNQAISDAIYTKDTLDQPKILLADHDFPTVEEVRFSTQSARWRK